MLTFKCVISPLNQLNLTDLTCLALINGVVVMSVIAFCYATRTGFGLCRNVHFLLLEQLAVLFFVLNANLDASLLKVPSVSPPLVAAAFPDLLLPANVLLHYRPQRRHLLSHGTPSHSAGPARPPLYSPLVTRGHPPTSSQLPKPSMARHVGAPPAADLVNISPAHSGSGGLPVGLAQPPLSPDIPDCCKLGMVQKRDSKGCHCVYPISLDLLLLNVSSNPDWTLFLQEFASQLGLRPAQIELNNFYFLSLSRLNISMDITPHTGISFPASEVSAINNSLITHKLHFERTLVGDYKLLNLTWVKGVAPSPAPVVAAPPVQAPSHRSATTAALGPSNKGKHSNLIQIFGISAGLLIAAIIFVLVICLCTFRDRKTKASPSSKETEKMRTVDTIPTAGSIPHPSSTRFLDYEELKKATNNFETASILGEGGFGRVYKGVLTDGTAVAIKKLTSGGQQGDKEFLVEIEMLSRLHHRNLVKLVGYYSSHDFSRHLLCYELVPNGSLESWLHGPLGVNCALDWESRMKIALDAARGLAYLHEDSQPCVIHRDFKASNILLENNFNAKVADFGLAKQAPEGRENYLSTRVMGTFGYVAPEYAMTGHLLVKSDVYSYGVVLLELLTGRKPVEMSQPSGQENLVTWARPILRDKERLDELADPRLGGKYPKEDFIRACTIAAACVAPEANQRPTMGEVVQSLKMVQRITEYQESTLNSTNTKTNQRQSSTTFESDGTSSIFSSGPFSGLSGYDHNDNISRTGVFSEDLHEGR